MDHTHHSHDPALVVLSILIAMFASYAALDLAGSITVAKGRARYAWLLGGSFAMGVGIWSMHFVGMLAFSLEGIRIAYEVPLVLLSIVVAIVASALALWIISRERVGPSTFIAGSVALGIAISGMHYIGIASMRMAAVWEWNYVLVAASIAIAIIASLGALVIAIQLRNDLSVRGFLYRGIGGVVMGVAIAGMHYTGMAAMTFRPGPAVSFESELLIATSGLAVGVIGTTLIILGIALAGSVVDRALGRQLSINRARDEFLSIASHELKTPLTSLKLQIQLRLRQLSQGKADAFTPERLKTLFENDSVQVDRITRLIDEMLDISRIGSGGLALHRERFDLVELAREIVARNAAQFEAAGCSITIEARRPVVGEWDRFRIEQVLTNLLTNAMKYGGDGPVRVEVARSGTELARLLVQDRGMGVPVADRERIFGRFERAVSASEVSGLGLGLYIVKQIVVDHGGRIWVESAPERGSIFGVELPLNLGSGSEGAPHL